MGYMGIDIQLTLFFKLKVETEDLNIEFDQMKLILLSNLGFSEKIDQLQLKGYIQKINCLLTIVRIDEGDRHQHQYA
jgi:hypothetical protein